MYGCCQTNTRWDHNDNYTICGKIGEGGNSYVYLIKDVDDNFFVLKVAPQTGDSSELMIQRETDAYRALENLPKRINCIDSSAEASDGLLVNEYPWIIIDYVPGTSLFDLLEKVRGDGESPANDLKPLVKYCLIYSIAKEIADIHEKGYTHRDIKPDNIFIDHNFIPYIGDFGDLTPNLLSSNAHGTINFMPPEAYPLNPADKVPCGHPYDVFMFGGTLLQIITFEWPFSDLQNEPDFVERVKERLQHGEFDDRFEPGGEFEEQIFVDDRDLYNIIKECWKFKPEERPTMKRILELIDESAQKYLGKKEFKKFERYKKHFNDENGDESLGSKENVGKAIENGFLSPNNRGLRIAAHALELDRGDLSFNVLEKISDRIMPSFRSACPHSKSYPSE